MNTTLNFINNTHLILKAAFRGKTPRISENLKTIGKNIKPDTLVKMTSTGSDVRRSNRFRFVFELWEATRRTSRRSGEIIFNAFETFHLIGQGTYFPARPEKLFAELLPFWDEFRKSMIFRDYRAATILINRIIADLRLLGYQLQAEAA